jgi:hypothetical protein
MLHCWNGFGEIALGNNLMDHNQAVDEMAAERYLLNELTPEAREAFEEHYFDCPECAIDLRAAAAFVNEAKAQLPALVNPAPAPSVARPNPIASPIRNKRSRWSFWASPAFSIPAFATLLLFIGYQNLVTIAGLREQVDQPRLLAFAPLHSATRGGARTIITADREHGVSFPIDLSPEPGAQPYASYAFDLLDGQGKVLWTRSIPTPTASESGSQRILLAIPGAMLNNGAYTVAVFGLNPQGQRNPVGQYGFDLSMAN